MMFYTFLQNKINKRYVDEALLTIIEADDAAQANAIAQTHPQSMIVFNELHRWVKANEGEGCEAWSGLMLVQMCKTVLLFRPEGLRVKILFKDGRVDIL